MTKAALALLLASCSLGALVVPPRDEQGRKRCTWTPVVVDGLAAIAAAGAGFTIHLDSDNSSDRRIGTYTMIAAIPFVISGVVGYFVQSACTPPPDEP